MLLGGGGGGEESVKSEKEKENVQRKNEVSSWGDLGKKAREEEDAPVM